MTNLDARLPLRSAQIRIVTIEIKPRDSSMNLRNVHLVYYDMRNFPRSADFLPRRMSWFVYVQRTREKLPVTLWLWPKLLMLMKLAFFSSPTCHSTVLDDSFGCLASLARYINYETSFTDPIQFDKIRIKCFWYDFKLF